MAAAKQVLAGYLLVRAQLTAVSVQARMNGGTNLTLAVDTAGNLMRDKLPEGSPRTLILLTDGRVDHYQGECFA